jgi:hypothetical protein
MWQWLGIVALVALDVVLCVWLLRLERSRPAGGGARRGSEADDATCAVAGALASGECGSGGSQCAGDAGSP